ncbi:MAG: hypothetical protein ACM3JD_01560 [Rudaea sp.]
MSINIATHSALRFSPPEPRSVEDTGLDLSFISDLALKNLYSPGVLTGYELAEALALPFSAVVEPALAFLRREHMVELKSTATVSVESSYRYGITDRGRTRARDLLNDNGYVGPAPVPLDRYNESVSRQSLGGRPVAQDQVRSALANLVLPESVIRQLGPAVNSGKSMFIFGEPGNGKTAISQAVGSMLPGLIFVPYAITTDGHIIKLYDDLNHGPSMDAELPARSRRHDHRWVLIRRPSIAAGGELTLDALDLVYDPVKKYYEAPYQTKANGGLFLIDDFGRQLVRPRDLLNRWIMPLEKRVDFLTLVTGRKIEVPFDTLVVFATNLAPADLVDEAFLRRIRYKIHVTDPTWDEYREIFRRECQERGIVYDAHAVDYLIDQHYVAVGRRPRGVHPRDILGELVDFAGYNGQEPELTPELLDEACSAYFLTE